MNINIKHSDQENFQESLVMDQIEILANVWEREFVSSNPFNVFQIKCCFFRGPQRLKAKSLVEEKDREKERWRQIDRVTDKDSKIEIQIERDRYVDRDRQ